MKKLLFTLTLALSFGANAQLANGTMAPDFTLTDINGNTHHLYSYLAQNKVVFIEFFACHCPSCWNYHNTNTLDDLYDMYGPSGTDQIQVITIEYDPNNGMDEFYGISGWTQGDWVTGTSVPQINAEGNDRDVFADYNVNYYPLLYKVCTDGIVEQMSTSFDVTELYTKANECPGSLGIGDKELNLDLYVNDQDLLVYTDDVVLKSIQVTNLAGQVVLSNENVSSNEVSVSALEQGIYLINYTANNKAGVKRIYID